MGRFKRGSELAKLSWSVIRKEKTLLILPVMSAFFAILIAASFFLPMFIFGGLESFTNWYTYIIVFAWYVLAFTVSIFFNVAILGCAMKTMDGEDTNISYGVSFAASRFKYILQWALFAATVGLILQIIRDKGGFIGQIISIVAGVAWTIATYFAVPVMVFEKVGPIDAIKRSVSIIRGNWAESLIATARVGIVLLLIGLLGIPLIILGAFSGSVIIFIICFFAAIILWVILAVVATTMNQIIIAALYRYATTGKTYLTLNDQFPTTAVGQIKKEGNW